MPAQVDINTPSPLAGSGSKAREPVSRQGTQNNSETAPWGHKEVGRTDSTVVRSRIVLGKVVGLVKLALLPFDDKLPLSNTVADPIESHGVCLGVPLFDSVVSLAIPAAVLLSVMTMVGGWG